MLSLLPHSKLPIFFNNFSSRYCSAVAWLGAPLSMLLEVVLCKFPELMTESLQ